MNVSLMYANEKFSIAVGYMASSTEPLNVRLATAWSQELALILNNDVSKLPAEIQTRITELSERLYAGQSSGAGPAIVSLVNALNEGQLKDAIDDIVSLHFAIIRAHVLSSPTS
jgi:hypothetical protein